MADTIDFSAFAPKARIEKVAEATARGEIVRCGWVPPDERTSEQKTLHTEIVANMPKFSIRGRFTAAERRYPLWQAGKLLLGKFLPYNFQQTGSCVGAGGDNAHKTLSAVEIKLGNQLEEFKVVWWPYTYGLSRMYSGMRGRGEGSTGSGWAKAITTDGCFEHDPAGEPDLPDFKDVNGWQVIPASVETTWSAGEAIPKNWRALGLQHKVRTAAPMSNADQCAEALMNGYPLTQASNFGFSPMAPKPQGDPPVRIATWNGSWSHQTYLDEVWDHPTLGLIFRWGNNWGANAHGSPTGEEPPGGAYIKKATLDQICKSGEVFALSAYDGYPARELNFSAF